MIVRRFCQALLALSLSFTLQAADELRLDQAVQMALTHNVDVVNSVLDVEKAADRSRAFHSALFPKTTVYALGSEQLSKFSFTVDAGSLGTYPGIGPVPAKDIPYSTSLQPTGLIIGRVSQPLSAIYRIRLNWKALDLITQISKEKARGKRQDTIQDVKQLYYNIEQAEGSLAVTRETIALYQEVERITNDYVAKQTELESDLLQVQANLAKAQESEQEVSSQEATQKERLNDLMGRDVLVDFTVTPMSDAKQTETDLSSARKTALDQRPEIREASLQIKRSAEELKAKRAEYIPDIAAEFNSFSFLNYSSFLPGGTYSVGFSLSWEPLDWGRKKNEIAEKRHTLEQDQNTEQSAQRKVIIDVDDKYRKMQLSWTKLNTARLSQRAAIESLRVAKDEYRVQAALLKIVDQGETAVAQANSDYQSALAGYWTSRAEFEHALGEDK